MKSIGKLTLARLSKNDRRFLEWCLLNEENLTPFMFKQIFETLKGTTIIEDIIYLIEKEFFDKEKYSPGSFTVHRNEKGIPMKSEMKKVFGGKNGRA